MATPHLARRAASGGPRLLPWLVLAVALALGAAAIHGMTYGFAAWTLDQRREVRIAQHTLRLPAIDVRGQDGQRLRLFAGPASGSGDARAGGTPGVYIVDFIYTRCPTVCRALGAEFAQLSLQLDADGMAGQIGLVSLSFDPRDTAGDLQGYANTYRARAPRWLVAAAVSAADMDRLLRQADVIAIPDRLGGFEHNGGLHVVDARGQVLAVFALDDFRQAYAFALAHERGSRP
ncbi:SCO family protein [Cupriavidus pauculus]|uniref:SCO family protein n=1 Tax=Cupriavidus pauculus TaxID=82633 RepID=A0A2N5C5T7_9BURK|nr:SCO family protein [Cupriavidus pauculus]PLP97594.1 SCO family protein [Cupriavidus pauculus]